MKVKKRFIAGAKCPKCEAEDTIMLFKQNGVEQVECVSCGHTMVQPPESVNSATRDFEQIIGIFKPEDE